MVETAYNIKQVMDRITHAAEKTGREPKDVKLVAVTKTVDIPRILHAIEAGITVIGENRVQEAEKKFSFVKGKVELHLIGHLQRNKVKKALEIFQYIHSVDSVRLAKEIQKQASHAGITMPVLMQVNVSGEKSKYGTSMEKVAETFELMNQMENLVVEGLMTIPPYFNDPEKSRPYFRQLKNIFQDLKHKSKYPDRFKELSMGMTNDFEVGIEEGATYVRLGTAIFGKRTT